MMDKIAQIPVLHVKCEGLLGVPAALLRGQQRVREIAASTGAPLTLRQGDVPVEKFVSPEIAAPTAAWN